MPQSNNDPQLFVIHVLGRGKDEAPRVTALDLMQLSQGDLIEVRLNNDNEHVILMFIDVRWPLTSDDPVMDVLTSLGNVVEIPLSMLEKI